MSSRARAMTEGSPLKHILLFMIPLLIGGIFQQFYNLTDSIIVGNMVGSRALAAVGATGTGTFFILSVSMGLTNAFSIVAAQHFGAGSDEMVKKTLVSGIYITILGGVFFTAVGLLFARPMLEILSTPADIIDDACVYLQICITGSLAQLIYNGAAAMLRAVGDSRTPLYFLIVSSVLNIVLDVVFVVFLHMAVAGVAIATVLSQIISAVLCIAYIIKRFPIFRVAKRHWRPDWQNLSSILKIGLPLGLQSLLVSIADMTIIGAVNTFGTNVLAAYTSCKRVQQFAALSFGTIAQASSVFAGQNLGAQKPERIREGFKKIALVSVCTAVITSALVIAFGDQIVRVFISSTDPFIDEIASIGVTMLRIYASFFPVLCMILLYNQTLRGMGEVAVPLVSSFLELAVKVGLSFALSFLFGYVGIWFAAPLSWFIAIFPPMILYHSGKWSRRAALFAAEST